MKAQEIRQTYRDYFIRQGHQALPSDSLIPRSDPTLLFTSAGMVQFKDHFLGKMGNALKRATTCQKCFRTSDIDSVGYTARHHTFFEMLGNFSFGDYFKQEAILWAWELLTRELRIPAERLWVSVYRDDDEAAEIWQREVGVAPGRILRFGESENFWTMGDTGPCGPCSEILYDMGGEPCDDPTPEIEAGTDRYLEIWNLVFTQYNRQADGTLTPLPRKNVDTGMGLERTAAVLQGAASNYETDLFMPIIRHFESISGTRYGQSDETTVALKVLADHSRATLFALTDQITPSNEGRGYVLRRIMRRAIRFARKLEIEGNFFSNAMEIAADLMQKEYPEVRESLAFAQKIAVREEESFRSTLERGMTLLQDVTGKAKAAGRQVISGKEVFRLYDTFGFPVEITREILDEEGLRYSHEEFESEMLQQRQQSQRAWRGSGQEAALHVEDIKDLPPTDFIGYESLEAEAKAVALVEVEAGQDKCKMALVLDKTPFYAESGGQVGDKGRIIALDGDGIFVVEDTQKTPSGVTLHLGRLQQGNIKAGSTVRAEVSTSERQPTQKNHTATHLLHAALRNVLGTHVKQAGSKVAPDALRFDYTHYEAPSTEQLREIEDQVNRWIAEGTALVIRETSLDEAKQQGAMALFGEKYGERVRLVEAPHISLELCGGTHVNNLLEIGLFRIVDESSIASGIRRIEAITGLSAYEYTIRRDRILADTAAELKIATEDVTERVSRIQGDLRSTQKELQELRKQQMAAKASDLKDQLRQAGDVPVLAARIEAQDIGALRTAMDQVRSQIPPSVICLAAVIDDKVHFLCSVDDRWTQKAHAGKIIQAVAALTGGRGGGKADRAQGGGNDPSRLDEALDKVLELVAQA